MEKLQRKKALEILIEDLEINRDQYLANIELNKSNLKYFRVKDGINLNPNADSEFSQEVKNVSYELRENQIILERNTQLISENINMYKKMHNELLKSI